MLLKRLSLLYQIPNWTDDHQEVLAEWTYDNYKYNTIEVIIACLKNPPPTDKPNWRLTPDTIKEWMSVYLEKEAERLEKENEKLKIAEKNLEPSESAKDFYQKNFFQFQGNVLNQPEKSKDQAFEDFKGEYISKRLNPKTD